MYYEVGNRLIVYDGNFDVAVYFQKSYRYTYYIFILYIIRA